MAKKQKKEVTIRSSAAEYLTFVAANGDDKNSVEVRYELDDTPSLPCLHGNPSFFRKSRLITMISAIGIVKLIDSCDINTIVKIIG